jgi:hypothetical protein
VIDRMPVSALKCLLRPKTLGSTIAGLIHRVGKRLIAQVVGNFAGVSALEPDLCASVGAGSPSRIVPYHRVQVSQLPPPNLRRR